MTSTQIYSNMNCIRHIILRLLDHPRLQLHQKPIIFSFLEKLHFTTLNYILDYSLHHKLFDCMFCTSNYDHYYNLHPDVKFAINLDEKVCHHLKDPIDLYLNPFKKIK